MKLSILSEAGPTNPIEHNTKDPIRTLMKIYGLIRSPHHTNETYVAGTLMMTINRDKFGKFKNAFVSFGKDDTGWREGVTVTSLLGLSSILRKYLKD